MKIEGLKYYKNGANITACGDSIYLVEDTLIKFSVNEGREYDEKEFKTLLSFNECILAKNYLFNLLSRSHKTEKEARQRLKEKGFNKESTDNAISIAKTYNFIDDNRYALLYIQENKNKKGRVRLKNELFIKGINEYIAKEALETLQYEQELESAITLGEKYSRKLDKSFKSKQKLYMHLVQKGFTYEIINDVLKNLNFNPVEY